MKNATLDHAAMLLDLILQMAEQKPSDDDPSSKPPTLAQAKQVLSLIRHKKVPKEQMQALIESGLLSDLLDAKVSEVNREAFRALLGLKVFPTWRTIRRTLTSPADALEKLEAAGHKAIEFAKSILLKTIFDGDGDFELVVASNAELGLSGDEIKLSSTYAQAKKLGLELCPSWVGPQLRLDYADQPLNGWLIIAMEALSDLDHYPDVFIVKRDGVGSYLDTGSGNPDFCFGAGARFVFVRRK